MIIRVNAVIPKTSEGSTVSAVINNNICKEREYVVSPSRDSVEVNAGRPKALKLCANAPFPKTNNIAVKKIIEARKIPEFAPGDTIKVGVKILEGKRERVQYYEGVCIAKKNRDINSSFTVRKISFGEGVERTFALYSPNLSSIKVVRSGKVRRAKLYYLRDRKGKSARIAEKIKKKIGVDVSVKLDEPKASPSAEVKKQDKSNEEKKISLKSETKTEKPTTEKK